MKKILVILPVIAIILIGCSVEKNLTPKIKVYKRCEDKVICFHIKDGYTGSGSCFRDEDLIKKYCN